jgi:hypothetical protein
MSRALKYVLLLLMGLLILTGLGILPINLFFVKEAINVAVRQNLGAELEIHGPLKLRLGFKPQLSASELSLYLPGAQDQPLVVVNQLSIYPELIKIFRGDIHLRSLNASDISIDYCPESFPQQDHDPTDGASDGDTPSFSLQKLKLKQVQLFCDQPDKTLSFVPEMLELEASAGKGQVVSLRISGEHEGQAIELSATMGSLEQLQSDPPSFPLQAHLSAFDSDLAVDSAIQHPLSQPGLTAKIEFKSGNPADLLARAGFSVPPLQPLQFEAEVKAVTDAVELIAVEGRLGQTQFGLSGLVRGFTQRPFLQLKARLSGIDLDRLPATTQTEPSNEKWQDISLSPLIKKLQQVDARVQIDIDEILGTPLSIENLSFSGRLDPDGLFLDRAELILAGSPLFAKAGFDLNAVCPVLTSELQLGEFDLDILNPFFDQEPALGGSVRQAGITTISCGETLGQHADSLHVTGQLRQLDPIHRGDDLPLIFDTLAIEVGQQAPGRLDFDGRLFGEPLAAEVTFGPLADVLSEATWPLTLRAAGAGSNLLLDGNAAVVDGKPILDVQVNLDINRIGALQPWFGSIPDSPLAGKASTRFRFQESGWSLADIDIRLGQSDLRGNLARTFSENGPLLSARLNSNLLQIPELAGLIPEAGVDATQSVPAMQGGPFIEDEWIEKWFALPSVDF